MANRDSECWQRARGSGGSDGTNGADNWAFWGVREVWKIETIERKEVGALRGGVADSVRVSMNFERRDLSVLRERLCLKEDRRATGPGKNIEGWRVEGGLARAGAFEERRGSVSTGGTANVEGSWAEMRMLAGVEDTPGMAGYGQNEGVRG